MAELIPPLDPKLATKYSDFFKWKNEKVGCRFPAGDPVQVACGQFESTKNGNAARHLQRDHTHFIEGM